MLAYLLKRALPFTLTLILGSGLWGVFGSRRAAHGGGGPGRYRFAHQRKVNCASTPVRILSQPEKNYTRDAVRNRTTGVVKLLVQFNSDGTTTVLDQLSALPDGLTEEAQRIAEQTRFVPATVNGEAVSATREMNYIFSLSDADTNEP